MWPSGVVATLELALGAQRLQQRLAEVLVVLVQAAGRQHLQCLQDDHQEAPDWRRESCVEDGASSALVVLVVILVLGRMDLAHLQ